MVSKRLQVRFLLWAPPSSTLEQYTRVIIIKQLSSLFLLFIRYDLELFFWIHKECSLLDDRFYLKKLINEKLKFSIKHSVTRFIFSFIFSLLVVTIPTYSGLSSDANYMLFILCFASLLWMTEAIPAFAVSFLIISLEILFLGFHDFNFDNNSKEWLKIHLIFQSF